MHELHTRSRERLEEAGTDMASGRDEIAPEVDEGTP